MELILSIFATGVLAILLVIVWLTITKPYWITLMVRRFTVSSKQTTSTSSQNNEYNIISLTLGESITSGEYWKPEISKRISTSEDRLFTLIVAEPEIKQLFYNNTVDINLIKNIYKTLCLAGAGQWAGTTWVPVAAVTSPNTLRYLLKELTGKDLTSQNPNDDISFIAWNVLNHFQRGEPLCAKGCVDMSNTNKPALEDFMSQIEEVFSQPLTEPAADVAEDFWNHWEKFLSGISNNAVVANVDALQLRMNFPNVTDIRQFSEELIGSAKTSSGDYGFAKLCAHYIAGTIQLSSDAGSAHWPQYPSNALSGEKSFVST